MRSNPLFNLIEKDLEKFKAVYNITSKTAQSGKQYFLIEPIVKPEAEELIISTELYKLVEYHISVYEDLNLDDQHPQHNYHLTFSIKNAADEKLIARIYFNRFNKIVISNLKSDAEKEDEKNNLPFNNAVDAQYARSLSTDFVRLFSKIYTDEYKLFLEKHDSLLDALNEKSKEMVNKEINEQLWREYEEILNNLLRNLKEWQQYDLSPEKNGHLHKYFSQLSEQVQKKINNLAALPIYQISEPEDLIKDTTEKQHVITPTIKQENPITIIDNQIKALLARKDLSEPLKIAQEYELLLKKFSLVSEDEQVLDSILRIRELERMANRCLVTLIRDSKAGASELESLIKMIPLINFSHFHWCVENNHVVALGLLLKYHPEVNLDSLAPIKNLPLLAIAYQKKNIKVFELLLQAGVYCDFRNQQKDTLLMLSCMERREKEMILLLQAGASNMKRNSQGFTAFGILTMLKSRKPEKALVESFIANCQSFIIDFMQGLYNLRCTPLIFACQENWLELVKVYLQHGSDPSCVRETDLLDSLAVCAVKGNLEICKIILAHFAGSINGYQLNKAIVCAEKYGKLEIKNLLLEHANRYQIVLESGSVVVLGIGASMKTLEQVVDYQLPPLQSLLQFNLFQSQIPGPSNSKTNDSRMERKFN